jgi:hypothetical protein
MNRYRGSAALLLATLVWGCQGPDHGAPSLLEEAARDSLGVQVQEFRGSALPEATELVLADEPTLRIGAVEGVPEEEWTQPMAGARLSDGSLAILEQRPAEIRVFDARGSFLRRIGRPGDGPGELAAPSRLAVLPGDTLAVWDPGAARISWFSPEGTLAREWSLREPGGFATLRHVALQADGGALLLGASRTMDELANQGRVREGWEVRSLSPSGEVGEILGTVPGTERIIDLQRDAAGQILTVQIQGRWWWGEGFVWPSPSGVWTAERTRLELRHIHPERGLDRVVRVDVPGRAFTRTLIDSIHGVAPQGRLPSRSPSDSSSSSRPSASRATRKAARSPTWRDRARRWSPSSSRISRASTSARSPTSAMRPPRSASGWSKFTRRSPLEGRHPGGVEGGPPEEEVPEAPPVLREFLVEGHVHPSWLPRAMASRPSPGPRSSAPGGTASGDRPPTRRTR